MQPDTQTERQPDITEFDAQDGMLPAILRPLFIPAPRRTDDTPQPPNAIQALAAMALLVVPLGMALLGGGA